MLVTDETNICFLTTVVINKMLKRRDDKMIDLEEMGMYLEEPEKYLEEIEKYLEEIETLYMFVDTTYAFSIIGLLADPYVLHTVPELVRMAQIASSDKKAKKVFFIDWHSKDSVELERFLEHGMDGTIEVKIIPQLQPYAKDALIFRKNSRSAIFAKNFIKTILKMKNLKKVVIGGWDTDLCVIDLAIPLQNLFDEINKRVEIIVPKNAVETYDSPTHNRDEYNNMAFKLMEQEGIKVVKKLERKR